MEKKIKGVVLIFLFLFSGCALFCQIPQEVKESEFLQYKQARRIHLFLKEVIKNPEILRDPQYKNLIEAIFEASESLVENIKNQSEFLGKPKEEENEKRDQ